MDDQQNTEPKTTEADSALNVGDSLFKKADSDFEYYIRKLNKDTIKRDVRAPLIEFNFEI